MEETFVKFITGTQLFSLLGAYVAISSYGIISTLKVSKNTKRKTVSAR